MAVCGIFRFYVVVCGGLCRNSGGFLVRRLLILCLICASFYSVQARCGPVSVGGIVVAGCRSSSGSVLFSDSAFRRSMQSPVLIRGQWAVGVVPDADDDQKGLSLDFREVSDGDDSGVRPQTPEFDRLRRRYHAHWLAVVVSGDADCSVGQDMTVVVAAESGDLSVLNLSSGSSGDVVSAVMDDQASGDQSIPEASPDGGSALGSDFGSDRQGNRDSDEAGGGGG